MMLQKKNLIFIALGTLLAMGPLGCADDSDNSGADPTAPDAGERDDEVPDVGSVTLTLSGEMERERAGTAEFIHGETDSLGFWGLLMRDVSPRTFQLDFSRVGEPWKIDRPEPGNYPIGQPGGFSATYQHVGDYDQPYQYFYNTSHEAGGTLTIETSTEAMVSGSFEFRALRSRDDIWSDEPRGEAVVSGTFTALPRE